MRNVIVTGGAGFIGSHTCVELAAAGYRPVVVDDLRNSEERVFAGLEHIIGAPVERHHVDCCDAEALDAVFRAVGEVHGVIHFAAYKAVGESMREPLKYYANNIGSLVTVLQCMADHGVRDIVFSSSCTVYAQPRTLPVDERAPSNDANSPYGYTKVAGERILRDAVVSDPHLRVVLLRYFNPIGAHPSARIGELPLGVPNNLVPFITQTAAGLRERLTVHGNDYDTPDGTCVRDYIHVVDLARAHVMALQWSGAAREGVCEAFNIGAGKGSSVLEVIESFTASTGVKVPYDIGPRRPGDVPQVYADATKAREVLGWRHQLDLPTALRDAWRWQQALAQPVH